MEEEIEDIKKKAEFSVWAANAEIHQVEFWEMRQEFEEQAERDGCHCNIKGCGDVSCAVTSLANYLNQAYWMGYKQAQLQPLNNPK